MTTIQKKSETDKPLVNRVAKSGLITYVLEDLSPKHAIVTFDVADHLWQGLVLREKEFRAAMKEIEWDSFADTSLCIVCSADAIVPTWAFMLVASLAEPFAMDVFMGTKEAYLERWFASAVSNIDLEKYRDARIVVKGCSKEEVPQSAYVDLVKHLQPVAKSIMYGEPCSTVPVFKRPKR